MTLVLALLAYAAMLAAVGPVLLRRAWWADRAPRLGIAAWQATSASVLLAAVLAGVSASIPSVAFSGGLAHLLEACVMALRAQYATPGGAAVGATGTVLALAVAARSFWSVSAALASAARTRRAHRDSLALLAKPDAALGALVVDHDTALAYCLPGRHRQIVLTTGALSALGDEQLRAVLAHERAHLRGRHHLVLAGSEGLARAFPRVPIFRDAREEITRLVELLADDAATHASDRFSVAEALVTVAANAAPARSLAAGGSGTTGRVHRLITPQRPLGRARAAFGFAAVAAALAAPILVAAQPALAAAGTACCAADHAATSVAQPWPRDHVTRLSSCDEFSATSNARPCGSVTCAGATEKADSVGTCR